jgi:hypothetical protein
LAKLGRTLRKDPQDNSLLKKPFPAETDYQINNPIFLYEINQLSDGNEVRTEQFRKDLHRFLGLRHDLTPMQETKEIHHTDDYLSKNQEMNIICHIEHSILHNELMTIAQKSSTWIRQYFLLSANDVNVSSNEYFNEVVSHWMIDPYIERYQAIERIRHI